MAARATLVIFCLMVAACVIVQSSPIPDEEASHRRVSRESNSQQSNESIHGGTSHESGEDNSRSDERSKRGVTDEESSEKSEEASNEQSPSEESRDADAPRVLAGMPNVGASPVLPTDARNRRDVSMSDSKESDENSKSNSNESKSDEAKN